MEEKDTMLWITFADEPEDEDKEIITKLLETVRDQVDDDSVISEAKKILIKRVTKVNDQKLWGLNIEYEDGNDVICPCVYIQDSIDNIKENKTSYKGEARKIIHTIKSCGKDHPLEVKKIMDSVTLDDLDSFKDNIDIRLISRELNKEFLEDSPYILFGPDLCGVFYISFLNETDRNTLSLKITNDIMISLGTNLPALMQIVTDNYLKKEKPVILPIGNVLVDMFGGEENVDDEIKEILEKDSEENRVVVITNQEVCYGSSCIMFRDTLKRASNLLDNSNLVILPSSVHEILVTPTERNDVEELVCSGEADDFADIIQGVNANSLDPTDVLHDQCFFYDASNEVLYNKNGLRIPFID